MLQMLKSFSKQGRLLEILLHGKKGEMISGYAIDFHWDDMEDFVIFHNVTTNRKKRILIDTIKKITARGIYNDEFKT